MADVRRVARVTGGNWKLGCSKNLNAPPPSCCLASQCLTVICVLKSAASEARTQNRSDV